MFVDEIFPMFFFKLLLLLNDDVKIVEKNLFYKK